jgi:hypothetical protein
VTENRISAFVESLNSYPSRVSRDLAESLQHFDMQNSNAAEFNEELFDIAMQEIQKFYFSIPVSFTEFKMVRTRQVQWHTLLENVSQITYPTLDKVTGFNCANFPEQPMFYGSNSLESTLLECGVRDEESTVSGVFELNEGASISLVLIGQADHVRRHNQLSIVAPDILADIQSIFSLLNMDARNAFQSCDAYLADCFRRVESHRYTN